MPPLLKDSRSLKGELQVLFLAVGSAFLVLATILPRVGLTRVGHDPVRPEGDATLRPKGGLRMRVTRR